MDCQYSAQRFKRPFVMQPGQACDLNALQCGAKSGLECKERKDGIEIFTLPICRKRCEDHSWCTSFTYDRNHYECWLESRCTRRTTGGSFDRYTILNSHFEGFTRRRLAEDQFALGTSSFQVVGSGLRRHSQLVCEQIAFHFGTTVQRCQVQSNFKLSVDLNSAASHPMDSFEKLVLPNGVEIFNVSEL